MFGLKRKRIKKKGYEQKSARNLVTVLDAKSIISEQFRTIRANITFATSEQLQTILITSTNPGEGKSTNAANLGVVFAQEGKKVLLVDADMRKPTLHYTFGLFNLAGLSTVLARKGVLSETVQETPIPGLTVLTSGPIPSNPAELLSSHMMNTLFEEMKANYDVIIFDAPPLLPVSDAQILANKCDGTLLIASTGNVEKASIVKAKTILTTSRAVILGVVLNNYKMSRNRKNYYQYYGMDEEA